MLRSGIGDPVYARTKPVGRDVDRTTRPDVLGAVGELLSLRTEMIDLRLLRGLDVRYEFAVVLGPHVFLVDFFFQARVRKLPASLPLDQDIVKLLRLVACLAGY